MFGFCQEPKPIQVNKVMKKCYVTITLRFYHTPFITFPLLVAPTVRLIPPPLGGYILSPAHQFRQCITDVWCERVRLLRGLLTPIAINTLYPQ